MLQNGNAALILAADKGYVEIAQKLIDAKANVDLLNQVSLFSWIKLELFLELEIAIELRCIVPSSCITVYEFIRMFVLSERQHCFDSGY